MAKGDIDKSDANGSQKQEKTKTGKDDKNPAPFYSWVTMKQPKIKQM